MQGHNKLNMHYKPVTAWIFIALSLALLLMFLYPAKWVIGLGVLFVPALLILQAYVILRADDESPHTLSDDKWYEDRD